MSNDYNFSYYKVAKSPRVRLEERAEEILNFLDNHKGCDLIEVVHELRDKFFLDNQDANNWIRRWHGDEYKLTDKDLKHIIRMFLFENIDVYGLCGSNTKLHYIIIDIIFSFYMFMKNTEEKLTKHYSQIYSKNDFDYKYKG